MRRPLLTMTCDHPSLDGATAADFLRTVKDFLEEPELALSGGASTTRTEIESSSGMAFPAADVAHAAGSEVRDVEPLAGGGFTLNTLRWRVELADGTSAFVKLALDELAAGWLRDELRVYSAIDAPFMPRLRGWSGSPGRTLLVLEDLTGAHWPPPWRPGDFEAARAALDRIHRTRPPAGLPALGHADLSGWEEVAADPEPMLARGLCTSAWLEAALPVLREVAAASPLVGDELLHGDFRSDNLCVAGDQVVAVDWNHACVGNPLVDLAGWLPSLSIEGGPEPWAVLPDSQGLAALLAGYFGARAGRPPPMTAAPRVREFQRAQAEVCLDWAARELFLPPRLTP